jgi:glutamate racemase
VEQPCASLAALIERGQLNTEEMRQAVTADTKPVLEAHVDTAIFGCTHYPFVQPLFEEICGDSIVFVDPAHETALQASAILKKEGLLNGQKERGRLRLCFTAEVQRGQKLAAHLLPPHEFTTEEVVLS